MAPRSETLFPWVRLNERERLVWAAVFAHSISNVQAAVEKADAAVLQLRSLDLDQTPTMDPEHEAARAGFHLEFDEFAAWYRVAWLFRHGNEASYCAPTAGDLETAYENFLRGRSEFS